jgi:hypothetical protein
MLLEVGAVSEKVDCEYKDGMPRRVANTTIVFIYN